MAVISGPPGKIASAQLEKTWLQHQPGGSSKTTTKRGLGKRNPEATEPSQDNMVRRSLAAGEMRVSEVLTVSAKVGEGKRTVYEDCCC